MKDVWTAHLEKEVSYWASMIKGTFHNKDWVAGFRKRVTGIDIAPSHLHKYISSGEKILDVGSGPATVLGGILHGSPLDITAVDPLASQYMELYKTQGVTPLVVPIWGEAENLSAVVGEKFDFVYSRNALDHSYDPICAISSMLDVCTSGGTVFFENAINEGLTQSYHGLHQWNFMPASGDCVIWKREGEGHLVGAELRGRFKTINSFVIREGWVAVEIHV